MQGIHEWADGQCAHAYMIPGTVGEDKNVLPAHSLAYQALKAIVYDKNLLEKMPLCVRFL